MFEDAIEQRLRPLAAAFASSELVRVRLEDDDLEIELRRARGAAAAAGAPVIPAAASSAAEGPLDAEVDVLTADLVGIVRLVRPLPSAGDVVSGDRELAFVEALGLRNAVTSRGRGRIVAIYVEDGQAVEYGTPLFAIRRDV